MAKAKKLTYEELEQENQLLKELITWLARDSNWPNIGHEIGEGHRVARNGLQLLNLFHRNVHPAADLLVGWHAAQFLVQLLTPVFRTQILRIVTAISS